MQQQIRKQASSRKEEIEEIVADELNQETIDREYIDELLSELDELLEDEELKPVKPERGKMMLSDLLELAEDILGEDSSIKQKFFELDNTCTITKGCAITSAWLIGRRL